MLQIGGNVDNGFCLDMRGIPKTRKPGNTGFGKSLLSRDGNAGNGFTAAYKLFPES